MADLSLSGWSINSILPNITGGTVSPYAKTNTADDLKGKTARVNDPVLASRQYVNPLLGRRDPVAVGSVYQQANVPAFLTQAVNDLNEEQSRKRMMLSDWQQRILDLYATDPANQYLLAPALAALSVQPGATFQSAGDSQFQNPLIGVGYEREASATASAKNLITGEARRAQGNVNQLENRIASSQPGEQRYGLQNELLKARSALKATRPGLSAAATSGTSGWLGPAMPTWSF